MTIRRFNWPLWVGLLLTLVAFITYFAVFVWFPSTRDFPWANLLIFLVAAVLVVMGVRRGFASDRPHPTRSKVITSIVAAVSVVVIGFFVFAVFVAARWLPPSKGAPQVGQQAPDFTLSDTRGKQVSLTELRTAPIDGKTPKGVLLIFYRGYW
jgi:predicted membrane channel-forming protein YqfA (hemolysin III family)